MARAIRQPADHVTCRHCWKDYRAITVLHLRNLHGYKGDHPVNEYKRRFNLQSALCREGREKISIEKEVFWARRGQHWTPARVLAAIRRLRRSGRSQRRQDISVRLYQAGRRYFGTWQAAVEQVGLNYLKVTGIRRWSREKVVEEIRELAERGIPLSATHIAAHHAALFTAAVKQFPRSWAKALRAAGYDPDEHKLPRGRWDGKGAAEWVRKSHSMGKSILARDAPRDLVDFVHNRLRTGWTDFVETIGIPYPGIKKRRDWSKRLLLSEIRRWSEEGHALNYRAVKQEYQALIHQARKFYGSWDPARAAAGV
jgi:hypothetical protein